MDGSAENATVATTLLANLVERGLDVEQGGLVVIDYHFGARLRLLPSEPLGGALPFLEASARTAPANPRVVRAPWLCWRTVAWRLLHGRVAGGGRVVVVAGPLVVVTWRLFSPRARAANLVALVADWAPGQVEPDPRRG